jgi:hypothetical protein
MALISAAVAEEGLIGTEPRLTLTPAPNGSVPQSTATFPRRHGYFGSKRHNFGACSSACAGKAAVDVTWTAG